MTPMQKVIQARCNLVLDEVFFGTLALRLDLTPDPSCETFWTDGKRIGFNPAYVESLTLAECEGVICVKPGEMIAAETYAPIETIEPADTIYGQNCLVNKTIQAFQRDYNGELIKIRGKNLLPFSVTTEHPILVLRTPKANCHRENRGLENRIAQGKLEWVMAKDLVEKLDLLFIPRMRGSFNDRTLNIASFATKKTSSRIINRLPLTNSIAWLMGLYVAEGHSIKETGTKYVTTRGQMKGIQFTLGLEDERRGILKKLTEVIRQTLKRPITIVRCRDSSIRTTLMSQTIGRAFETWFGSGAKNKKIPDFLMLHRNYKLLRAFLLGYFQGDGCFRHPMDRYSLVQGATVSKGLALQIQMMCVRIGILPNLYLYSRKAGYHQIRGRSLPDFRIYQISVQGALKINGTYSKRQRSRKDFLVTNRAIFTPISKIEKERYKGPVYNLKTTDNTYLVNNAVVHNCHEVLHVSNGHPWRRGGRDMKLWQWATDAAINSIILSAKMILPVGAVLDPSCDGLSAEQIYERARQQPPSQEQAKDRHFTGDGSEGGRDEEEEPGQGGEDEDQEGEGDRDFGCGEVRDCESEDAATLEAEWQVATLQAAQAAKAQGKLPAGIERLVEGISRPRIDWRSTLRRFVQTCARRDFTWTRPNRRYVASGLYLPALQSEQMPPVVIYWDTSGSRDYEDARAECAAEVASIIEEMKPERTYVIYGDTQFQHCDEFEPDDPIKFNPKGGGGTDFKWIIPYIEERGIEPACLIGITDGWGTWPNQEPGYPVLWVMTTDVKPPFGEILKITEERTRRP